MLLQFVQRKNKTSHHCVLQPIIALQGAVPLRSPPNGCLYVVLVADLHVGGAQGGDLQPAVPLSGRLTGLVTDCVGSLFVCSR